MTYRVEVTASTINELSGKLAALASQLKGLPSTFDVLRVEASEINLPAPAPEPAPKPEPAPAGEPTRTYTYDGDISPRVMLLVTKRGRDFAKDVILSCGADRASKVSPSRYPELMAAIDAALGEAK